MKKLLILSTGVVSLAAAGLMIAPSFVHAQSGNANINGGGNGAGMGNGYQQSLTTKAKILGMTEDQLKTQLQSKTLIEIAKDKGISEDQWHGKMEVAAQARWKANGLTQAEIDARTKTMEEQQANCDGTGNSGGMHRGNR
ncbi:MAG: hypothetical protein WCP03_01005 [Candidatus Saccharibacteria bacterium]